MAEPEAMTPRHLDGCRAGVDHLIFEHDDVMARREARSLPLRLCGRQSRCQSERAEQPTESARGETKNLAKRGRVFA